MSEQREFMLRNRKRFDAILKVHSKYLPEAFNAPNIGLVTPTGNTRVSYCGRAEFPDWTLYDLVKNHEASDNWVLYQWPNRKYQFKLDPNVKDSRLLMVVRDTYPLTPPLLSMHDDRLGDDYFGNSEVLVRLDLVPRDRELVRKIVERYNTVELPIITVA